MYAVIKTGGKQYKISEGDRVRVEKLPYNASEEVTLKEVLLVEKNGEVTVGAPFIKGAEVIASVVQHGKADKVISFKYTRKSGFHKTKGHRQTYTELLIKSIKA